MSFKVLSFDMFQTLVDVNARKYTVWGEILKERYSKEKAEELWQDTLRRFSDYAKDENLGKGNFNPMYHKFSSCYKELFKENNIQMDVEEAVDILLREHGNAQVYQDAKEFFSQIDSKYRIWISSDTDRKMILPLLQLFKYEYAFISEEVRAYKQDEQGRFFAHVLETTGVSPEEIVHVGDGLSDIVGAKQAGITACWINRDCKRWEYDIKPDLTIQSLVELNSVL